jgi:arylsulfatase
LEVARVFTVGIWQRGDFRNLADAKWMLFSVKEDFSESSDVADKFPEKPKELERMWRIEAARIHVLPLDGRSILRQMERRPTLAKSRETFT